MRKNGCLKILWSFAFLAFWQCSPKNQNNETESILDVENKIAEAVVANDTLSVAQYFSDDFLMTVPEGVNITKRQFLDDMKSFWKPHLQRHTNQTVKVSEHTAIITGLVEFRWKEDRLENREIERYTDTYAKINGKWLKYASHTYKQQQPPKELEVEVKKVVETLWKAWESGDSTLAKPIYNEEFIDTDFEGVRRNRSEVLAFLKPLPNNQTSKIELSDWRFIVRDNIVVVNYIGSDTRNTGGKITNWKFRATDTYIKKYGHWQLIAGQQILIQ